MCDRRNAQRANLRDRHLRERMRRAMRRVVFTNLIRPWRIGNEHAIGTSPRKRRGLSADRGSLAHDLEPLEWAIDATSAIHVGLKLAEFFRLGFRGVADGAGLCN